MHKSLCQMVTCLRHKGGGGSESICESLIKGNRSQRAVCAAAKNSWWFYLVTLLMPRFTRLASCVPPPPKKKKKKGNRIATFRCHTRQFIVKIKKKMGIDHVVFNATGNVVIILFNFIIIIF